MATKRAVAWMCRNYHFAASHRLVNPKFTDEENRAFYGKCTNPNGHGHNFQLEVTVEGPVDPVTGRSFPPKVLDTIVQEGVVDPIDHKNLNTDVPELTDHVTTGENLTALLWKIISAKLPANSLKRLRLDMSPSNSFEYYGER